MKTGEDSGKVVALDTKTMPQIYGELVLWGHHYNQVVRALNTIALFASRGGNNIDYFVERLERANRNLEDVRVGEHDVENRIRKLEGTTLVGGQ